MENTITPKAELYKRGKEYWMKKCERLQNALDCANRNVESKNEYIEQKKNRISTLCNTLEDVEKKLSRARMMVSVYKTISWIAALGIIIEVCVRIPTK